MEIKYSRVSSQGQNLDRQGKADFADTCSGSIPLNSRPQGAKMLAKVAKGEITAIRVHSIDRLGRNTLDILQTIESLTSQGINVISEKEGLQTLVDGKPNPIAKMILGILSTLAEFERAQIRERQREGIEKGKARGVYKTNGGRNAENISDFLNKEKNAKCLLEIKRGESIRRAASLAGVSASTAQKIKKLAWGSDLVHKL